VLLRPDCQDFHGTSVLIEVAQRLNGSRIYLVPNMVTRGEDPAEVRREIRETFGHEVVGVFPFTEEMAELGSRELFSVRYSSHPLTAGMNGVLDHILKDFDDPRDD
jgi:hypothetical protein